MPGIKVDPVELHLVGGRLSTAADDAAPHLAATSGSGCGRGFPGTAMAAHAALVDSWRQDDRTLIATFHSIASNLHRSAETYIATDDANANHLQAHSPSEASPRTTHPRPLSL